MSQQTTARAKATPRTVAELEEELKRCDGVLLQAHRASSAARTRIPSLMAAGDSEGHEEARREIATFAGHITDFTDRRAQILEAIEAAKTRDRSRYAAEEYTHIKRQVADFKTATFRLAESIDTFAKAFMQVRVQQDAMEAVMRNSGVSPDPYLFRTKFIGMTQMSLWLATDKVLGDARTLDTPLQLKDSGRADLRRAATETTEVLMRQVRQALGLNLPTEAA